MDGTYSFAPTRIPKGRSSTAKQKHRFLTSADSSVF
jgi:hypothetical protein